MIVVQLLGGMGNQMFQYAIGKTLAIRNDSVLKLDTSFLKNRVAIKKFAYRNFELDIFNIEADCTLIFNIPSYSEKRSIRSIFYRIIHIFELKIKGFKYLKELIFSFSPSYLGKKGNLYLDGYWQSFKYFVEIEDIIRKDFTFNFQLQGKAQTMSCAIGECEAVCVHIRRGDYLKFIELHGVIGNDYVLKGIEIIVSKVPNAKFFVFSNDIEWCQVNLKINHPTTYITEENAGNNDKEHFQLMTQCKYFIIANSTFSWWAAWLAANKDKIVIAPQKWVATDKIDTKDIIPESWIKV